MNLVGTSQRLVRNTDGGQNASGLIEALTKPLSGPTPEFSVSNIRVGGVELSWLDFDPGRTALTAESEAKLKKPSQAMKDRRGLGLEVAGRSDAAADTEGSKRARLEASAKGAKLKDMVQQGDSAGSLDPVTVSPEGYPKSLKQVYGDGKFPKPRNLIGFAKDLPVPEMEKLILPHSAVTDDDLKHLVGDRAQAGKDYLTASGQVAPERVFGLASPQEQ